MREIKYRALHANLKQFITGLPAYGSDNEVSMLSDDCDTYFDIIPETIGQYIGLKDKNGKEIYEGDIVHCAISEANYSGFIRDFTATVQEDICNPCFCLKEDNGFVEYDFVMCDLMILEVIGNVHEEGVNT